MPSSMFNLIWADGSMSKWIHGSKITTVTWPWSLWSLCLRINNGMKAFTWHQICLRLCGGEKNYSWETFPMTTSFSSSSLWARTQKAGRNFKVINQPGLVSLNKNLVENKSPESEDIMTQHWADYGKKNNVSSSRATGTADHTRIMGNQVLF